MTLLILTYQVPKDQASCDNTSYMTYTHHMTAYLALPQVLVLRASTQLQECKILWGEPAVDSQCCQGMTPPQHPVLYSELSTLASLCLAGF